MKKTTIVSISIILVAAIVWLVGFSSLTKTSVEQTILITPDMLVEKNDTLYLLLDERELEMTNATVDRIDFGLHNEYVVTYHYGLLDSSSEGEVVSVYKYGEQAFKN